MPTKGVRRLYQTRDLYEAGAILAVFPDSKVTLEDDKHESFIWFNFTNSDGVHLVTGQEFANGELMVNAHKYSMAVKFLKGEIARFRKQSGQPLNKKRSSRNGEGLERGNQD